ncbi:MAG: transposase [Cetobacterium sp.]
MLEVKAKRQRPVLELVKQRSRRHLMHIIRKRVQTGTQILSECWRAYNTLQQHGYLHYQVNHRHFFVHPQTDVHTQHMERAWRTYKENIYRYTGNLTKQSL